MNEYSFLIESNKLLCASQKNAQLEFIYLLLNNNDDDDDKKNLLNTHINTDAIFLN